MQIMKQMSWVSMSLILVLSSRAGWAFVPAEQSSSSQQQSADLQPKDPQPQKAQPTKPGADDAAANGSVPASREHSNEPVSQTTQRDDTQQSAEPQQHNEAQKPSGAAAAEAEKTSGVAASRPAGMAIAPAKQHRRRAFWVKLGAVAGAGLAAGTVFALSRSTSSKPPGSH
jgi:ferric-dicitrate binding protein FerR (iron transport regulator)